MELSQRKPNRLSDFDYNQNGAYFVTICTQNRKKILSDIVGDGSPVPPVHKNRIMNRITDRILSVKTLKKDAV